MRRLRGLRSRLTLALVAVSALTLAITAGLLLVPLDRALRDDALSSLSQTARAARPTVQDVPADDLRAGSSRLRRTLATIRRQTGADVAVVAPGGRLLSSTDADDAVVDRVAGKAIREHRTLRSGATSGDDPDEAQVSLPFRVDGASYALVLRRSLTDLSSVQAVVRRALLVAGAIALGIAVLVGLLLASRLVARVTSLRDTALRVTELGVVVEVRADDTRDEIGDLTRAFAGMQQQLRDQEDARRTFVSTASHELRTPLASLLLMLHATSEDLAQEPPELDEARAQVGRALGQTERLTRLSATLLDLSRLDARLPLRSEPVELGEVARSVIAEFPPDLDLVLRADDGVWCTADPGSVAQIVRVLVDNAVLHGLPPIAVRVSAVPEGTLLVVSDGGEGVPETETDRVFERFERGSGAAGAGSGLGLAIGRELARRMAGDLVLVAGDGGRLELRLPAVERAPNTTPT